MSPGELVQSAREARGWTRSELARRASVDRALLTRIEQGSLTGSVDTLVSIAAVLDIDLNLLKPEAVSS